MRSLMTFLALGLGGWLTLRGQVSTQNSEPSKEVAQIEAQTPLSVVYAQVLLNMTNNESSPIFIPACSYDSYEICWYFAHLEQRSDRDPSKWQRTHYKPIEVGDVLLPSRILKLEKGESCGCVFKFAPRGPLLPDGSYLKYPGKIRAVILAWKEEKYVGDPARAFELRTQEFEIPPPPETWGTQVSGDAPS